MLKFTKMHGLGNDYVFIFSNENRNDFSLLSKRVSNRNFGIGSDGLIVISNSTIADFKMRIFNLDGSEAKMCGNGIRCVGKFLWDKGYTSKKELTIETNSGIKNIKLITHDNKVKEVEVYMGKVKTKGIYDIILDDKKYKMYLADIGNLHGVILTDKNVNEMIEKYGEYIYKLFGKNINVEFIKIISNSSIEMAVYERGSGITLACGTGAVASYYIANKFNSVSNDGIVVLKNGEIKVKIKSDDSTLMIGNAQTTFDGIYYDD